MRQKREKNTKKCEKVAQDLPKRCPIRWSQILGFFQVASKLRPRGPRGAQEAPKTPQERPKSIRGQERPQTTQERPKSCQERPQSDRNLPEGRPMCQQRHVFCAFLCFLLFCSISYFFFLGVCCIFLRLLSFFASLRVNVTRHRIWGGASNRGVGKG